MRRPAILMRFPRLRLRRAPGPVIAVNEARRYPALVDDIRILDQEAVEVGGRFRIPCDEQGIARR